MMSVVPALPGTDAKYLAVTIMYAIPLEKDVQDVPGNPDPQFKTRFINSCDAMIHAQRLGESFGLACGEFSSRNKPVITLGTCYGRSHLEILGDKALLYNNRQELVRILLGLSKQFIGGQSWDCYSERFAPRPVMEKFKQVFLDRSV